MLGRRNKQPVLAEVPLRESASGRAGSAWPCGACGLRRARGQAVRQGAGVPHRAGTGGLRAGAGGGGDRRGPPRRPARVRSGRAGAGRLPRPAESPGLHEYLRDEADAPQILQPLVSPARPPAAPPSRSPASSPASPSPSRWRCSTPSAAFTRSASCAAPTTCSSSPALRWRKTPMPAAGAGANTSRRRSSAASAARFRKRLPIAVTGTVLFTR